MCPVTLIPGLGTLSSEQFECLGDRLFNGSESGEPGPEFARGCNQVDIEALLEQRDVRIKVYRDPITIDNLSLLR